MDATLDALVGFVHGVRAESLPAETVHEVVRHVVDTVGCGAGGFTSEPAQVVRRVVRGVGGPLTASVYGEAEPVLVDHAAWANATAGRYLDFNDFGLSGHPSDMIPAVLAMAEATGASGATVVAGVYVAYEIATSVAERVSPTTGWDQGAASSLGVAGALSLMMGLDRDQTAHAFSLALVPSVPLKVTRYGELSAWKAAAVPHATMTATLAARLADAGMSGPAEPFAGRCGMFAQAWEPFELAFDSSGPSAIERSSLKAYGACYWAQVGIDLSVDLREQAAGRRIDSVDVATTEQAYVTIGGGAGDAAQKWAPATRETADHSMPFLLASALLNGRVDESTFQDLAAPGRRALMKRVTVRSDPQLTAQATRDRCPTAVRVHLEDGEVLSLEGSVPRGHPTRPMTDAQVAEKFRRHVSHVLPERSGSALEDALWGLWELSDLTRVGSLFREFRNLDRTG